MIEYVRLAQDPVALSQGGASYLRDSHQMGHPVGLTMEMALGPEGTRRAQAVLSGTLGLQSGGVEINGPGDPWGTASVPPPQTRGNPLTAVGH